MPNFQYLEVRQRLGDDSKRNDCRRVRRLFRSAQHTRRSSGHCAVLCLSCYLLKLAKPETRVHLPKQIAGGVERLFRALGVALPAGEASEAPMTVPLER